MKKLFTLSLPLLCVWFAAGCSGGDSRQVTGQPVNTSAAATSDEAKRSIQQGVDNARITQQIMQTHRLPNGQPLPSASNPGNMQPPGFRG